MIFVFKNFKITQTVGYFKEAFTIDLHHLSNCCIDSRFHLSKTTLTEEAFCKMHQVLTSLLNICDLVQLCGIFCVKTPSTEKIIFTDDICKGCKTLLNNWKDRWLCQRVTLYSPGSVKLSVLYIIGTERKKNLGIGGINAFAEVLSKTYSAEWQEV